MGGGSFGHSGGGFSQHGSEHGGGYAHHGGYEHHGEWGNDEGVGVGVGVGVGGVYGGAPSYVGPGYDVYNCVGPYCPTPQD